MNIMNFLDAFDHFIRTGQNVLDHYSELTYLRWDSIKGDEERGQLFIDDKKMKYYKDLMAGKMFWKPSELFDEDTVFEIKYFLHNKELLLKKLLKNKNV